LTPRTPRTPTTSASASANHARAVVVSHAVLLVERVIHDARLDVPDIDADAAADDDDDANANPRGVVPRSRAIDPRRRPRARVSRRIIHRMESNPSTSITQIPIEITILR